MKSFPPEVVELQRGINRGLSLVIEIPEFTPKPRSALDMVQVLRMLEVGNSQRRRIEQRHPHAG